MPDDTYLYSGEVKARRHAKPHRRTYAFHCPICHTWQSCATLELQTICNEAGACVGCIRHDYFVLRIRIVAIATHLEQIVARGKTLPEDKRDVQRELYRTKAAQLAQARAQLAALVQEEVPA